MNRTQAIERVDQILCLFTEMYHSGRCPRCSVRLYADEDGELPSGITSTRQVIHAESCEVVDGAEELARLSWRFAIPLEPVLLASPTSETWIVGVRRGKEPRADAGRATSDLGPDATS